MGDDMPSVLDRDAFLRSIWDEIINPVMEGYWIDDYIQDARQHPNAPFADVGPALERLLALGVDRADLCRIVRANAYETVFGVLHQFEYPGCEGWEIDPLHEEILIADPSGMEGRPGSWPIPED
ncbi:MAG: hypothetical protein IT336_04075 [Thermomicrobiales bacterium]|nr:hypothetical protein [Thermomicrobiales bacterium]